MTVRNNGTPAYTFSADTTAVFTFVIAGIFGMFWPFVLYAFVALMRTNPTGANGSSGNNADAMMAFINDLNQIGPLRYLIWAFTMAVGFVVTGFVSALVVFVCRHKWRG